MIGPLLWGYNHCNRNSSGKIGGDKDQDFGFRQKEEGSWVCAGPDG